MKQALSPAKPMDKRVIISHATAEQAPQIATLIMEAMNHECCQWFAGADHSLADFHRMMTALVRRTDSQYSYLNTLAALDGGELVGILVCYDGSRLHELRRAFLDAALAAFGINHSGINDETQAGELYLDSLCVSAPYRGRGIATTLIRAAADRARQLGIPQLGLLVDAGNPRAEHLYRSIGFRLSNPATWGGHPMHHLVMPV